MKITLTALTVLAATAALTACADGDANLEPTATHEQGAVTTASPAAEEPQADYADLEEAVRASDAPAVEAFVQAGADLEADLGAGYRALHVAIARDDADVVRVLVNAGADLEAATDSGTRALSLASLSASLEVVDIMLDGGADPNNPDRSNAVTSIMQAGANGNTPVLASLVAAGADIDAYTETGGWSALAFAIDSGHLETSEALIDLGASTDMVSRGGTTAHAWALLSGEPEIVQMLEDRGLTE